MSARSFASRSAADTRGLGRMLGHVLVAAAEPGLVVALDGDLGAGKTVFVKGLAEGLGLEPDQVSSPTFVLAQQYIGREITLHHVDLYRIDHVEELEGFGFDELLDPPNVAAVEWSCRFEQALPVDRLAVHIEREQDGAAESRRIGATASGPRSEAALREWNTGTKSAV